MKSYTMRIRYGVYGGHTHAQIYTGTIGETLGLAGNLTLTNEEFEAWKNATIVEQFVDEEDGKRGRTPTPVGEPNV